MFFNQRIPVLMGKSQALFYISANQLRGFCRKTLTFPSNVLRKRESSTVPQRWWRGRFVRVHSQNAKDSQTVALIEQGNSVTGYILLLRFQPLPGTSKLLHSAHWWEMSCSFTLTHNGATSCPQWASTSRALLLFKNVFALLFFFGAV